MHLVYIDDSKDEASCCFSAIIIPAVRWSDALNHLIAFRRSIKDSHGVYVRIELHATDWLGGRGNIAPTTVMRSERAVLFRKALEQIALIPECAIINAHGPRRQESVLFERLCNRVQRNMAARNSHAILISDEGKNFDGLVRKLRRHNPIQGRYGRLLDRPLDRIIEDIVYRKSDRSLFIQAADFCAFSLLRFEAPTPKIERMGLANAFLSLERVLEKRAYGADPRRLGIVRV